MLFRKLNYRRVHFLKRKQHRARTNQRKLCRIGCRRRLSLRLKQPVPTSELPSLIAAVHASLQFVAEGPKEQPKVPLVPAVSIKKSVQPDYIVCLEDGKKFQSLKRHLRKFDMTPDQYREKWGLPRDYPMVAPNYASRRSELAKAIGLGQARKGKPSKKKAAA